MNSIKDMLNDTRPTFPKDAISGDKEGERWMQEHPDSELEPCGYENIKSEWFAGLWIMMDYFIQCVKFQKRTRIVIDYDPQTIKATVTYFRAKEKRDPQED